MVIQIQFPDKMVTYETFINDLATALVPKIREALQDPSGIVSQKRAFKLFGEGNVRRWLKKELLVPVSKRPGKVEYRLSDLRLLQARKQDYL